MKRFITILLILSILLLTTSCELLDFVNSLPSGDNDPTVNPDGSINYVDMTPADYDQINKLVTKLGTNVAIRVVSNNRGALLTAEYVISDEAVVYSVEQLNMLPEDADINKLPDSMTSTYSGVARFNESGEIVTESGEVIALPEGEVLTGKFNFNEDNFREGKRSPTGFEGEVISVSSLLGVKINVDSMKVKVDYHETAIARIVLTYVKDGATVTVTYAFD